MRIDQTRQNDSSESVDILAFPLPRFPPDVHKQYRHFVHDHERKTDIDFTTDTEKEREEKSFQARAFKESISCSSEFSGSRFHSRRFYPQHQQNFSHKTRMFSFQQELFRFYTQIY